jgi:hypothetical protein
VYFQEFKIFQKFFKLERNSAKHRACAILTLKHEVFVGDGLTQYSPCVMYHLT